jgi:hypothetical protein
MKGWHLHYGKGAYRTSGFSDLINDPKINLFDGRIFIN